MARHIETKEGLKKLHGRMMELYYDNYGRWTDFQDEDKLPEFKYWVRVVLGCIDEGLAMDEVDYENAPDWFRPLWRGLK